MTPLDDTAEYPPVPSYTAQASKLLSDRLRADGFGGFDPSVLLPIVLDLIVKLFGCQPTPAQGYAYLTWKPVARWWYDWLPWASSAEERLANYRNKVNAEITRAVAWTVSRRDAFVQALWAAVDAGDLTPAMMSGLYAEARG